MERYRLLIVDDEPGVLHLAVRALRQEGFVCDTARDGETAAVMTLQQTYDAVIVDLRMPKRHGHSLAVELLGRENPPLIIVATGVIEPRLAEDLYNRGVHDVLFKPINYQMLGTKLRSLLRRHGQLSQARSPASAGFASGAFADSSANIDLPRIELAQLQRDVSQADVLPPLSSVALEILEMTQSGDCESSKVTAALQLDAALAVEVLKIVNSSFFNPGLESITNLEEAVIRIGNKRIGEVACAAAALATLDHLPHICFDPNALWRRSMAAGFVASHLTRHAQLKLDSRGLFLGALLHETGRIVLAHLYPQLYQKMLASAERSGIPLTELEQSCFPLRTGEIISRILADWLLPDFLHAPLRQIDKPFDLIDDPKALLIKLAGLCGRIAAADWFSWDYIELPGRLTLGKLKEHHLPEVIRQAKRDLETAFVGRAHQTIESASVMMPLRYSSDRHQPYYQLGSHGFDFLAAVLESVGIALAPRMLDELESDGPAWLNCIEMPLPGPTKWADTTPHAKEHVWLVDADVTLSQIPQEMVVRLPCSMARIVQAAAKTTMPEQGSQSPQTQNACL